MDVDRARQKRKNAQREAHQKAEEIKIRPGHTTPRAQQFTSATYRCGARAGIQTQALLRVTPTLSGSVRLSCGERRAANDRCPSVAPHSDDCRGAILPRGARLSPASGGFPPAAKSRGANLRARR